MKALLDKYAPPQTQPYQELVPQQTTLVIDAYFRSRGDGTLIFRSPEIGRNLLWFDIRYETVHEYLRGVDVLQHVGWEIAGFTVDGRRGVIAALSRIAAVQHCQFHQAQTIRRYLTMAPQLPAAQELKAVVALLTITNRQSFEAQLLAWYEKWHTTLKQRTYHPSGAWSYTHQRLRRAYRSVHTNLPHLFTYQEHLAIPNTTNSLDGSISHVRTMHRVHQGLQLRQRRKVTDTLLRGKYPKKLY